MGMDAMISVRNLRREFGGEASVDSPSGWTETLPRLLKQRFRPPPRKVALDGVEFDVRQGELLGLVGANGAGKTTLLKILSCIMYPTSGTAIVAGHDIIRRRVLAKASVSLLKGGGWTGLFHMRSVYQNLLFYADLCGLPPAVARRRAAEALDLLDLTSKAAELPWHLSAGQAQKVCLAMLFMVNTPVMLMDEPTAHLDPGAARAVRRFTREVVNRRRGQTVLMSTHFLREADYMCDRVAIIDRGKIIALDTPSRLKSLAGGMTVIEIRADRCGETAIAGLRDVAGVADVRARLEDAAAGRYSLNLQTTGGPDNPLPAVLDLLTSSGAEVKWTSTGEPSLEDVYLKLVGRQIA
jgi:ABC-2 type transport system ATP-binding protein